MKSKTIQQGRNERTMISNESLGEVLQLDLFGDIASPSSLSRSTRSTAPKKSLKIPTAQINLNKTFESFYFDDSNIFVFESLKRFVSTDRHSSTVLLVGDSGVGKSHLLHAVANKAQVENRKVFYTSPLKMKGENFTFQQLEYFDFLIVDDLDELDGEGFEEVERLISALMDHSQNGFSKLILATQNAPEISKRLRNKLAATLKLNLFPSNTLFLKNLAQQKLDHLDVPISQEASQFLQNYEWDSSFAIDGTILTLNHLYQLNQAQVELAQIASELPVIRDDQEQILNLVDQISCHYNVSRNDLFSHSRQKDIVWVRHFAILVLREKKGLSLLKLAKLFNRDHSSIIHALEKMRKLVSTNIQLKQEIDRWV